MSGDDLFGAAADAGTYTPVRAPYVRSSMADLAAVPPNGLTAVSTFSGCGGSSVGLRLAGWRVPYAVEFVPAAARTYRANSDALVDERDIREVRGAEILDSLGLEAGELDLLEGSPPCASWSAAGTGHLTREGACPACEGTGERRATWEVLEEGRAAREVAASRCKECAGSGVRAGVSKRYSDTEQRTDDLFAHFVRLLRELSPRAFVAENVPGMIRGDGEAYAHAVMEELREAGYRAMAGVLNAAHFGVPQARGRLIFIGYRADLGIRPELPARTTPEPWTLREALAEAEDPEPGDLEGSSMERFAVGRTWRYWTEERLAGREPDFARLPCQRCGEGMHAHEVLDATREGLVTKARCGDGERAVITKDYFSLVVPDADRPCPTITATGANTGAASVTHPWECRKLTPAEALSVSGFPRGFRLIGSREERYERVGRAVMPPLYEAVGRQIAGVLR